MVTSYLTVYPLLSSVIPFTRKVMALLSLPEHVLIRAAVPFLGLAFTLAAMLRQSPIILAASPHPPVISYPMKFTQWQSALTST